MGILPRIFLDGFWRAAVGIPFAEDGIHSAALDLVVACLYRLLFIVRGLVRIVWKIVPLRLQFGNCGLQLRNRGADVGKLDDVRFRFLAQFTQLGQRIRDSLLFCQFVGEGGQNSTGQRNVACVDGDIACSGKCLDDR